MLEREDIVPVLPQFEPLLDCGEAAQLLHVHPKTLQRWAREGLIPGRQISRCWYFRQSELNDWWMGVKSPCHPPRVQ